ncbi:MAG TPA: sodium/solute symporter [Ignavibacteriaceae bacterium]|nr:sodium/solute symporter [Ignavibacteriaceae bacterium]
MVMHLQVDFTFLDSLIILVYLVVVLSLGFYFSSKKDQSYEDYFLAGKKMGWITVGLSIFATNISSEHFIGLAGSGAARGLAVGQFELMAVFTLILLGWLIAPIYIKSGAVTTPEFLEKRFDPSLRKPFAAISIVIYILAKISVSLFAGGILFERMFGINIYTSAIMIVLFTGLYSVLGGATAVMKTHVFQAVVLIVGALLLTIFGLRAVGGFSGLQAKLPPDYFSMFKSIKDPDYPWTGVIFGAPILAFWYWITDQYFIQKILSAKSINDARRGSLFAAILKVLPIFILVLPGLIAAALFQGVKGDDAYPLLLASDILPIGIKGIVMAGLLAAIMSSLASVFNTVAALFTNDFYKVNNPGASDRELVLVGRLSSTAIVILAIICVPLVKLISSQVYLYMQSLQGYISPPIAAVFLWGFILKKVNAKAAITTLIVGESIGFLRMILDLLYGTNIKGAGILSAVIKINFLHFSIFLFLLSTIIILALSYLPQREKKARMSSVQYLVPNSLSELAVGFSSDPSKAVLRTNMMMSAFILLIIIGLWSIWF